MPTVELYPTDDCFKRARNIIKCCNIHEGADFLVGAIAEVIDKYRQMDEAATKEGTPQD